MARFYVNINGKELINKLEKMSYSVEKNGGVTKILEDCGQFMTKEMKEIAPKRTGRLRASLDYKIKGDMVQVGVQRLSGRLEIYSYAQEFGTRRHSAQPYVRTTFEANYEKIKQEMVDKFIELLLK